MKKIRHAALVQSEIEGHIRFLYTRTEETLAYAEKFVRDLEEGEEPIEFGPNVVGPLRLAVHELGHAWSIIQESREAKKEAKLKERNATAVTACVEYAEELEKQILATPSGTERNELSVAVITLRECLKRIREAK